VRRAGLSASAELLVFISFSQVLYRFDASTIDSLMASSGISHAQRLRQIGFFYRATLCVSAVPAVGRCPSIRHTRVLYHNIAVYCIVYHNG